MVELKKQMKWTEEEQSLRRAYNRKLMESGRPHIHWAVFLIFYSKLRQKQRKEYKIRRKLNDFYSMDVVFKRIETFLPIAWMEADKVPDGSMKEETGNDWASRWAKSQMDFA